MITVFTPTYNRKKELKRLYDSLNNQINKDFIWLVIDDGSSDGTKTLVENFIKKNQIKIKYIYQKNSGKHVAYNRAISLCTTELFACVDSDDYLSKEYTQFMIDTWMKEKNPNCIGILSFKKYSNKPLTTIKNKSVCYSTLKDAYDHFGLKGDAHQVYKTGAIKEYKFPVYKNEKFCPEIYLFDQFDQIGVLKVSKQAHYIVEYQRNGLSDNWIQVIKDNPSSYRKTIINRIKIDKNIYLKWMDNIKYVMYSKIGNNEKILKYSPTKVLTIAAYLPGLILARYLRKKIN